MFANEFPNLGFAHVAARNRRRLTSANTSSTFCEARPWNAIKRRSGGRVTSGKPDSCRYFGTCERERTLNIGSQQPGPGFLKARVDTNLGNKRLLGEMGHRKCIDRKW